jgi:hypothetical protein
MQALCRIWAVSISAGKNTAGNGKSDSDGDRRYSKDPEYNLGEYLSGSAESNF